MDDKQAYAATSKSKDELEKDIDGTRARISEDIDALSYKLSPQRLREQAQTKLHDAQEAVVNSVTEITNDATARVRQTSHTVIDVIKENPLPAALLGLGVGLLAAGGATAASGSGTSTSRSHLDTTSFGADNSTLYAGPSVAVDGGQEDYIGAKSLPRPGQTSAAMGSLSGSKNGLARWIDDYPLAVGAVALLVGAAVGLSAPGTRYEDDVMGAASDDAMSRARHMAGEAVEVAKETALKARDTAQEEIKNRAVSTEDVKSSVKSAVGAVKKEVSEVGQKVVESAKETAKQESDKRGLTAKETS